MSVIKDVNLEKKVNKAIGNLFKNYFENNNILKSDSHPLADDPAKFIILIGKKEFFKELEHDLKEVVSKELENNEEYNNNKIIELKTEEALKKVEKITSGKSRYVSFESIEQFPFEFLIKHYNENRINDKITDKQLNLFTKLKQETFKDSIDELLEKKEDDKLHLEDIKEHLNNTRELEIRLFRYRYYEEEQTVLDKKEVSLAIDLKTFQRIKEHDWFKMEGRLVKEILIPNYEKNIYEFMEKVEEASDKQNKVIPLNEFMNLVDNFEFTNEKADIEKLLNKKIENYFQKEDEKTREEILDFICQNINNPYPNVNPLQYFKELGIGELSEEIYKETEEYYFIDNFYKVNNSEDKENQIKDDICKLVENRGDMTLLEANETLIEFRNFDNEKFVNEVIKLLPNIVERNDEDIKIIKAENFKENMKEQFKMLREKEFETKEIEIKKEKSKDKEIEY